MARLKVYEAEIDGLHQWIVAAPNQRAALDAFGVHQDLFAQGLARVFEDADAAKPALERPGTPLRRPKGGKGGFEPVAGTGVDVWEKAAASAKRRPAAARADRGKLDAAESALKAFEDEATGALEALEREREALERRAAAASEAQAKRRKVLELAIRTAAAAYRKAGGRP